MSTRRYVEDLSASGDSRDSSVVFLLGAGASRKAGLPLLADLTQEISNDLPSGLARVFTRLHQAGLPAHEVVHRNIEDLLTSADAIASARLTVGDVSARDAAFLAHEVRKVIWNRLAHVGSTDYLLPLRQVVEHFRSLSIASLNNDLVVEQWAEREGLPLFRGFDASGSFDSSSFDRARTGVRLLKLHGSIDWIPDEWGILRQQSRGGIDRLLAKRFRSPVPEVAVVFPSRVKVLQARPLRELFVRFDRSLDRARLLVVVGCRLGDAHVRDAVVEGCRRNRDLSVLVVDPGPIPIADRLIRSGIKLGLGSRIDVMPLRFEDALAKGRLLTRIEGCLAGARPLGYRLIRAIDSLERREDFDSLRAIADELEDPSSPARHSSSQLAEARSLLLQIEPRRPVVGGLVSLVRGLIQALDRPPEVAISAAVSLVGDILRSRPLWHGGDLATFEGEIFGLSAGSLRRFDDLPDGSGIRGVEVVSGLGSVQGLAMRRGHAVLFRKNIRGRDGLRRLECLNLQTGRRSAKWLRRPGSTGLLGAARFLITAMWAARSIRPHRERIKEAIIVRGYLSWATTLAWFPGGDLLIVESRRALRVKWPACRVVQSTERSFLNFNDAAISSRGDVYLSEGGVEGDGRLVRWRTSTSEIEIVIPSLQSPRGVALDPTGSRVLVALAEAGTILAVPLDDSGGPAGEPEVVMEGLRYPRWLRSNGRESWYVSTSLGVLRIERL